MEIKELISLAIFSWAWCCAHLDHWPPARSIKLVFADAYNQKTTSNPSSRKKPRRTSIVSRKIKKKLFVFTATCACHSNLDPRRAYCRTRCIVSLFIDCHVMWFTWLLWGPNFKPQETSTVHPFLIDCLCKSKYVRTQFSQNMTWDLHIDFLIKPPIRSMFSN